MSLTCFEQETLARVGDDTDLCSVWTSQPKWFRRLTKAGAKPSEVRKQEGREVAWRFLLPAGWFRLRPPRRVNMTSERKEAGAKRLAEGRARKKGGLTREPIAVE